MSFSLLACSRSLKGKTFQRKSDGALVRIEGDAEDAGGRSNRSLRALNLVSGRSFWLTPEGLTRKYVRVEPCPDCEDPTYYRAGVCDGCGYCDHCERPGC